MSQVRRWVGVCVVGVCLAAVACGGGPRESYERGLAKYEKKEYREAAIEFRRALQDDPKFAEARQALGRTLKAGGDRGNAAKEFSRAADLLPNDAAAQVEAAEALLAARRFPDAKDRAERALKLDSRNAKAQMLLGQSLASQRDFDGAMEELERAIELDPASSLSLMSLASVQLAKGDKEQAQAAFLQAVNMDPKAVTPRLALANFYAATGDRPSAEKAFREAATLDPKDPKPHRALALFLMSTGRVADAEGSLKQFAELSKGAGAHMLLADYYLAANRLDEAEAALRNVLDTPAGFSAGRLRLSSIRMRQNKFDDAHRVIDEALKKEPNNATVLAAKANLLLARKDNAGAIARARAAVAADPAAPLPHKVLALALTVSGETEEAIREYARVAELNPRDLWALLESASLHLQRGRPDVALSLTRQVLQHRPDNAVALLLTSRALSAKGDLAGAGAALQPVGKVYKGSPLVHSELGILALKRKQFAEAEAAFVRALSIDSTRIVALEGLVEARLALGKKAEARQVVNEALKKMPKRSGVLYVAARVAAAENNAAETERLLRAAVDADANDLKAYTALGRLYINTGRIDQALENYRKLAAAHKDNTTFETMIGMLLESKGDIAGARAQYEKVVGLDGRAAIASNNLAWIYADAGEKLDRALELAQVAKQKLPDAPEINDTLGWVYYKKDLPHLAISAFEQSVKADPNRADYQFHLGLAYIKRGQSERAREALQRALALQSDFPGAPDARRALATLDR